MTKKQLIFALAALLIVNFIITRIFPFSTLTGAPFVLSIAAWMVAFHGNGFNDYWRAIITYLFVGLNDIGIRLGADGGIDQEGMGWMFVILLTSLVPVLFFLILGTARHKNSTVINKVGSILLFCALIGLHLLLFSGVGVRG